MKFTRSHSHLKRGDYCWAIVNSGEVCDAEIVKIDYDSIDKQWFVDNGEIPIKLYVFGEKIQPPEIYDIENKGVWKVQPVPFCPIKIDNLPIKKDYNGDLYSLLNNEVGRESIQDFIVNGHRSDDEYN